MLVLPVPIDDGAGRARGSMISHLLYRLWRDAVKALLRYAFFARIYARWRLREVSTDVRSSADAEHDLVRLGQPVIPVLLDRLDEGYAEVRTTALRCLLALDRPQALAHARRLADDADPRVASLARQMLQNEPGADGGAS